MRHLRQQLKFPGRRSAFVFLLAQAITVSAFAQNPAPSDSGNVAKGGSGGGYSLIDWGPFIGYQWDVANRSTPQELNSGIYVGGHVTENFWRYVSLDEIFAFANNPAQFQPLGNNQYASDKNRVYDLDIAADFFFTPREAKVRPYVFAGIGPEWFKIGGPGRIEAPSTGPFIVPLNVVSKEEVALVFGGGVKWNASPKIAWRFDLTTRISKRASFGMPSAVYTPGQLYVPSGSQDVMVAISVGVDIRSKYIAPPPPPPPPAPAPAPPPPVTIQPISGARDNVCAGDNLTLQTSASGGAAGSTITYQWMVNGQPVSGATGQSFSLPTSDSSGSKEISVKATAGDQSATSNPVTVNVLPLQPPTISFNVSPSTVDYSSSPITLAANASPANTCNGNITVSYSGDGVTGSTFNPGAVSGFDPSNRLKLQSRTVTLTATATDQHNQTASATAPVTVELQPAASRTDIVFPNRSARVNNAAKRYLIEILTPKLRDDPNSTVILIGHRDSHETGRAAAHLDRDRVLNAAAVLSAGKGVCPSLDLSRVQVKYAGTDQTDEPMPFGDASVRERSTGRVRANDENAKFRRVEVWFIPGGAAKPDVQGLEPAPERQIKAKGCPR